LGDRGIVITFAKNEHIMLGVKSEHDAPHGKAAVAILAKLLRIQTNHLNKDDLQELHNIEHRRKTVSITWN